MNVKSKSILNSIVAMPGFITYDLKGRGIEVKKGRFSPVYINMKSTWSCPMLLTDIADGLKEKCIGCNCVIGIETGGSPFASIIAKELEIPLVLARKEPKNMNIFAGEPITGGGSIAIIDDVLATGLSMKKVLENIQKVNRKIILVVVLSYGMEKAIAKKYGIIIHSLYSIEDVIKSFTPDKAKLLEPYILSYQKKLIDLIK